METHLPDELRRTPPGREAESILRACVHCGFCTATCPTYRLTGDEDDGPRGRIYLIKTLLEEGRAGAATRHHLDRCLLCRACETTCPSGVRYHRLMDIARAHLPPPDLKTRLLRRALLALLPHQRRARALLATGRRLRPILPRPLADHLPPRPTLDPGPALSAPQTRVVLFQGCVEPTALADAHAAAVRLLAHLGIAVETLPQEQCCGALEHHLDAPERARRRARANLRRWRAALDDGAEAILFLSSACLLQVREYPELLADEPDTAQLAKDLVPRCLDLAAYLDTRPLPQRPARATLAWHPPCTLQHGLGDPHTIPRLLARLGYHVRLPADSELCCGAGGAYTLLQPRLSQRLGENKRAALDALGADAIVTANVGCLLHLQRPHGPPVRHWIQAALEAVEAP